MDNQLEFFLMASRNQPAMHPDARKIVDYLMGGARTQSELFYLFNGRLKKSLLMPILEGLKSAGTITSTVEHSGGRPRTVWRIAVAERTEEVTP